MYTSTIRFRPTSAEIRTASSTSGTRRDVFMLGTVELQGAPGLSVKHYQRGTTWSLQVFEGDAYNAWASARDAVGLMTTDDHVGSSGTSEVFIVSSLSTPAFEPLALAAASGRCADAIDIAIGKPDGSQEPRSEQAAPVTWSLPVLSLTVHLSSSTNLNR
jgi:hypothetical protein